MSAALCSRLSSHLRSSSSLIHNSQRPCTSTSIQEVDAENESIKPRHEHDFVADRARANCAIYGVGLTKSGALSIRSLVVQPRQPQMLMKLRRITFMNTRHIRKVAAGFGFSLFASPQLLFGSGLNNFGQLGGPIRRGSRKHIDEYYVQGHPIRLPENARIIDISAGRLHSLVATSEGIFAFGDNTHGQCGADPAEHPQVAKINSKLPKLEMPSETDGLKCKQVLCTLDSSFVLMENGALYSFGLSVDGQLGTGCVDIEWRPQRVALPSPIRFVHGSADTLLAVTEEGEMYIWGQAEYQQASEFSDDIQLPMPTRVPFDFSDTSNMIDSSPIRSAAATATSCVVLTESGHVYSWGSFFLGSGPTLQRSSRPVPLAARLFGDSASADGRVRRVFAGVAATAAVTEAGRLFTWGSNRHGGLALGHINDQLFPFQVHVPADVNTLALGPDHTLVVAR